MAYGRRLLLGCTILLVFCSVAAAIEADQAKAFIGQDLRIEGKNLADFQITTSGGEGTGVERLLVLRGGMRMIIGANQFTTDRGVFLIEPIKTDFRGAERTFYQVRAYLEGQVDSERSAFPHTSGVEETEPEGGMALMLNFSVMGEVFIRADEHESADVRGLRLYGRAIAVLGQKYDEERPRIVKSAGPTLVPEVVAGQQNPVKPGVKVPEIKYPVNISSADGGPLKAVSDKAADGTDIATVTGRLYIWQQKDEQGNTMELEADSAVVFYSREKSADSTENAEPADLLASGLIEGVYLRGNVVMREGERSIRADEMFYDFQRSKALASNAVLRTYDPQRGIPIYVRAVKLRQLAENRFVGNDVVVTNSEFYAPQVSMGASSIAITDMTSIDEAAEPGEPHRFNAVMKNAEVKLDGTTLLKLKEVQGSTVDRLNVPLESVSAGYGSRWGASMETRWYLARLLGVEEDPGTKSRLLLDYFSKRGIGAGIESEYAKEDHFGQIIGYVMNDHGEDRLGRIDSRRNIEPPHELRGRFDWRHRQFLPYDWQFTGQIGYSSDEYFIEQFYRGEYNIGARQETSAHMKRIEDNWGLSFLGKARINDFYDVLEEGPTGEFHWTGQSLWDDRLTLYSDTQVSRLRQRIGSDHSITMDENSFGFLSHRTELDMPLHFEGWKVVPYAAQTFGMDDRSGFERSAVDGSNSGLTGNPNIWIAESGVRVTPQPLWKVYPNVHSRLWDLNQLRHIVKPHAMAAIYKESDTNVDQPNVLAGGLSQLLQTKRGPLGEQKTVDWMRLDTDLVFVEGQADAASTGPDRLIWNQPMVPLRVMAAPEIFNGDLQPSLQHYEMYGPRRNYFSTDYVWRVSETSAFLGSSYYDIESGVVQQYDLGIARMVWPDLSYYIGNRYLRRTDILGEKGSNSLVFALTYVLDPRYTAVLSHQYDFDYGKSVRSDITLIRKYNRVSMGLTFSADESIDSTSVVMSFWPQGVTEMALGSRRYSTISAPRY